MLTKTVRFLHSIRRPTPAETAVIDAAMRLHAVPRECPATFADDLAKLFTACKALATIRRE